MQNIFRTCWGGGLKSNQNSRKFFKLVLVIFCAGFFVFGAGVGRASAYDFNYEIFGKNVAPGNIWSPVQISNSLPVNMTLTRASVLSVSDNLGVLQSVGSNTPAFEGLRLSYDLNEGATSIMSLASSVSVWPYSNDFSTNKYSTQSATKQSDSVVVDGITLTRFSSANFYGSLRTQITGLGLTPFIAGQRYLVSYYAMNQVNSEQFLWMRSLNDGGSFGHGAKLITGQMKRIWQVVQATDASRVTAITTPTLALGTEGGQDAYWLAQNSTEGGAVDVYVGGFQIDKLTDNTFKDGIAMIGDSTMAGSSGGIDSSSTNAREVSVWLGAILNVNVFNRAIGGNKLTDMETRWATDITPLAINSRYVVIQGGINDIANGATLSALQTSMNNLVAKATTDGMLPVIFTCTPTTGIAAVPEYEIIRNQFNAWLLATFPRVIDIASVVQDPSNHARLIQSVGWVGDGIHYGALAKRAVGMYAAQQEFWGFVPVFVTTAADGITSLTSQGMLNNRAGDNSSTAASVFSASGIPVSGPWAVEIKFKSKLNSNQITTPMALWGSYKDANNYVQVLLDSTTLTLRKRVAGTNYDSTMPMTVVANQNYAVVARINTDYSTDIFANGTKGIGNANTAQPITSTNGSYQILSDGNGANQMYGSIMAADLKTENVSDADAFRATRYWYNDNGDLTISASGVVINNNTVLGTIYANEDVTINNTIANNIVIAAGKTVSGSHNLFQVAAKSGAGTYSATATLWNTNPLFVSVSDSHLQATSPAINAGINVGLAADFENNSIQGTPDIGAYEFQDSTAPTTTANINTGLYNSTQSITLTCDDGAGVGCDKIYYTTNGDVPTTGSTQYTTPLSIATTTTLKFFAQDRNQNSETPQTKIYTIDTTPPTISNIQNNYIYYTTQNPTFAEGTATLNGQPYTSGADISGAGDYIIILTDSANNSTTVLFTISKTKTITDTTQIQADYTAGAISITGSDPAQTTQAIFNTDYTINTTNLQVTIPQNTQMTKTGGGNLNLTQIVSLETTADNLTTEDPIKAIKFGIPNLNLTFSQPITINITVGDSYNNQTLKVYYQSEGQDNWNQETTCLVATGVCFFQTTHATKFAAAKDKAVVFDTSDSGSSHHHKAKKHKSHKPKTFKQKFAKKFTDTKKWIKKQNVVFTRNLSIGSRGNDVGLLQTVLQKLGLLKIKDTTYGVYLSLTKDAVTRLQTLKHILPSGNFGLQARKLFSW